jgi:hypothetical protein
VPDPEALTLLVVDLVLDSELSLRYGRFSAPPSVDSRRWPLQSPVRFRGALPVGRPCRVALEPLCRDLSGDRSAEDVLPEALRGLAEGRSDCEAFLPREGVPARADVPPREALADRAAGFLNPLARDCLSELGGGTGRSVAIFDIKF